MKCTQCAVEVISEAIFCHQCGHRLAEIPTGDSPREKFRNAMASRDGDDPPEQELWQGKYSSRAMVGAWIGAALFSLGLIMTAMLGSFSGTGWIATATVIPLVWLGLLARLFYRQLGEHYFLTNQRFIHERGLLWREIDRIEAIDIDDVSFQQGPIERALGVGTIRIRSSDESHPNMELPGIEKVRDVAEMIDEVRRQERRKRGLHVEAI